LVSGVVVEKQGWEERMMVCLDCSGELVIYRGAWVLRGRVEVDTLAMIPASVGARRWRSSVLHVQEKLMVATARSGGVGWRRIASMSGGGVYGIFFVVSGGGGPGSGRARVWRG
jgi:hypothetical protein